MTLPIEVSDLRVTYGDVEALRDVSLTFEGGAICGVLGRNGAGKTTLLATLAAYRRPTSGTVRIAGEDPFENARLMADVCLVRDGDQLDHSITVKDALEIASALRPRWDAAVADRLVEGYELPLRTKVGKLSRGKQAALAISIGIATRAAVTMFDEPHLGMDAPSRYAFYDELLADYIAWPRTILLSTHLIDEIASLLQHVVIVDRGRVIVDDTAPALMSRGAELTGPADAIDAFTSGMRVLSERQLGGTKSAVVFQALGSDERANALAAGLDIGPIPLQDLFVHLTDSVSTTKGSE